MEIKIKSIYIWLERDSAKSAEAKNYFPIYIFNCNLKRKLLLHLPRMLDSRSNLDLANLKIRAQHVADIHIRLYNTDLHIHIRTRVYFFSDNVINISGKVSVEAKYSLIHE